MSDAAIEEHEFQYSSAGHEDSTAVAGMWLFLATEVLFFGGLLLVWIVSRHARMAGFDAGSHATNIGLGTINTVLLVTSSFFYVLGNNAMEAGDRRGLMRWLVATMALGTLFLALKGYEWSDDFHQHLWPGAGFALAGPDPGGARLFFSFYFVATALHGVHMLAGIGLVGWVVLRARRGAFAPGRMKAVEVVGLYWSFVDMVWLTMYPLIYLIGRG